MADIQNNSDVAKAPTGSRKLGPRKIKRIYEAPTREEIAKLLQVTRKIHHETAWILAFGSGLRIGEVLGLQPDDVDLKTKRIFIRQGKGKKDRVVNASKLLKEKHIACLPIKITARALEAVFLRLSLKAGINRIIAHYEAKGKQMPIYKYHFHSLRHHFATQALAKGLPVNFLQTLLGHESLATTNRYTKANPQDAIQAALDRGM